ncbi:hypothetical protein [Paraglaciecola sp. 25GB23A]|uniref:hypothetical protein n=1 Tax=Paraglaciecola sp. 25GB23A TaxID=3156068 RepID=UPI0032AECC50
MSESKPLSKEEFVEMLSLVKRYSESSMDQWETWKIDSSKGKLFIDLRLSINGYESAYTDLSDLLNE